MKKLLLILLCLPLLFSCGVNLDKITNEMRVVICNIAYTDSDTMNNN